MSGPFADKRDKVDMDCVLNDPVYPINKIERQESVNVFFPGK